MPSTRPDDDDANDGEAVNDNDSNSKHNKAGKKQNEQEEEEPRDGSSSNNALDDAAHDGAGEEPLENGTNHDNDRPAYSPTVEVWQELGDEGEESEALYKDVSELKLKYPGERVGAEQRRIGWRLAVWCEQGLGDSGAVLPSS